MYVSLNTCFLNQELLLKAEFLEAFLIPAEIQSWWSDIPEKSSDDVYRTDLYDAAKHVWTQERPQHDIREPHPFVNGHFQGEPNARSSHDDPTFPHSHSRRRCASLNRRVKVRRLLTADNSLGGTEPQPSCQHGSSARVQQQTAAHEFSSLSLCCYWKQPANFKQQKKPNYKMSVHKKSLRVKQKSQRVHFEPSVGACRLFNWQFN